MYELTTHGPAFLYAERGAMDRAVTIFGAPFDSEVSFRTGARFGPDATRLASDGLESYSPALDLDLEDIRFCDMGNVEFCVKSEHIAKRIDCVQREILERDSKPIMLGGDHSLTPYALRPIVEQYPNLLLIQLDAHADLRDEFNGSFVSHANAMRRALDFLPASQLIQYGIRSGDRAEFVEMREAKRLFHSVDALKVRLMQDAHRPIYLTIDLDVFDPSLMSGTGTPEFGGIFWKEFEEILFLLMTHRIVAADVMELAPQHDPSGCSAILASKLVRELALVMGNNC
ncbi:MAG: agmatinase [Bradymonadales bacterium]|jgi:agmatinase